MKQNKLTLALREALENVLLRIGVASPATLKGKRIREIREFIKEHHTRLLAAFAEIVEGIGVSGGGSGRRLKEQLLSLLHETKKEI